jgi:hypothetical protein
VTLSSAKMPATPEARVADLLGVVLEMLPATLVAEPERAHLWGAARPFASLSGEAVVEVHLGGSSQRDFTARVWPTGAREALARAASGACELPPSTLRFLSEWVGARGPLARAPYVELEQDIVCGEPRQWVGPAIRPDFRFGGNTPWTTRDVVETGLAVLQALPDWPLPGALLARFRRFVEQLPAGIRLNMMSSLGAREHGPREGLRMILSGSPEAALDLAALNEINSSRAQRLLSRYGAPSIGFDLELGADGLADYFAFYRRFSNPSWSDPDLRVFLDHALGEHLLTRQELGGFRGLGSVSRRGHLALTFKLVLREHAPARLKAYVEQLVY